MDMSFRAILNLNRPAVEREVFVELGELNEFYRTLPPDKRAESAGRIVGLLLLAYDDPKADLVQRAILALVTQRHQQGVSLRDALMIVAMPRRAMVRVLRQTYPDRNFYDDLEKLTQVIEELAAMVIDAYDRKMSGLLEEHAAAERRYRLLYDRAPIMMHSIDAEGRLIELNEEWECVLGYTRAEALGRKSVDFMTEASRDAAISVHIPFMLATGYVRDVAYQFVKKNGELVDILISAIVVRTADGHIDRVVGVLRDITEQLRADRALMESEEQYRDIVERAPLGICIHRSGAIIYANGAMQRLLGVSETNVLVGKDLLTFTHPDVQESMVTHIEMVEQSNDIVPSVESRILRSDGEIVDVEVFNQPVTYEGSAAIQFVFMDISARKRADDALRRAAASENTLAAQEEIIRALSSPLIPFGKGALLMPLIGNINQGRAVRILEELARGVVEQQATVAILDVTGVPHVDSDVADALLRAASVGRLLGAEVMLTGIQPAIAKMIVELGIDMSGFTVKSSLREGLSLLMRNREWQQNNQRGIS